VVRGELLFDLSPALGGQDHGAKLVALGDDELLNAAVFPLIRSTSRPGPVIQAAPAAISATATTATLWLRASSNELCSGQLSPRRIVPRYERITVG
jgi:hypothetical protein